MMERVLWGLLALGLFNYCLLKTFRSWKCRNVVECHNMHCEHICHKLKPTNEELRAFLEEIENEE